MNEKLLGTYLDRADEMLDKTNTKAERASILQIKIQARIARQLTIANEIAMKRAINELRAQQGLAVAYPEESFDKVFDEPTPTPDIPATNALVDAVKEFINGAEAVVDEDMILCDYDISVSSVKRLEEALAAHKKAGK